MAFSDPKIILSQFGISQGICVVDLGSGAGGFARPAKEMVGEDGVVYAVDIQKELLDKLHHDAPEIEVVWADLEKEKHTRLRDGIADVVIIANMLFQVENKQHVLREAHRLLKTKGRVLFIDWKDSFGGLGPHEEAILSKMEAQKLLEEAGFVVENDIDAGDHHYGFVVRK